MKKLRKRFIALIIVVVALIVSLVIFNINDRRSKERTKQISFITYESNSSEWENMRQGAEDGSQEYNGEISFCTVSSYNDPEEQIEIIKREVENGADGILLAPCDSEIIGKFLDENDFDIPIVLVKNNVISNKEYDFIGADDYGIGKELGEAIVERESSIAKVAIISDGLEKQENKRREEGVLEAISPVVNNIVIWERDEIEKNLITRKYIQNSLLEEAVDVVVALDGSASDALLDALLNLNRNTRVYMISTSDKSVYYLDKGIIKCLEYSAEYEMGYIGTQYILNRKEAIKKYGDKEIEHLLVDEDNMYDKEIQDFIFPFVK